ncbi:MAG: RNase adapter RapZ [Bacteroidales bacterium]|nr:phosphotransferase [Bacteroidales bacterium]MDD2322000.1 RNase adapter RapZ [Bacteroidales bacterium]MDD3010043.1 RNase adapter RapZ [Bacteroidales bacterium]MDD3960834.1 RNase adapter RapZ [Bacteroidales bacterium]MDY0284683.1 RNase adapter RapZ [Bacteroidales bacterium]
MNKPVLISLFKAWCGVDPEVIVPLAGAGSDRSYFRLKTPQYTAIGVFGPCREENEAFIAFTTHFSSKGLPVPQLLQVADGSSAYLLEDLGDQSLFSVLQQEKQYSPGSVAVYYLENALDDLARFQTVGHQELDYSHAWPVASFDRNTIIWDLNYFKYCFLKPMTGNFQEYRLENDFQTLSERILQIPSDFFMYRDFQSRNIMLTTSGLRYIDYQGGRRGPRAYDVVSLLWQARATIPPKVRELLLDGFIERNLSQLQQSAGAFREGYYSIALLRTLQVLGAYGFRGLMEKKLHFIQSIPFALQNLQELLQQSEIWADLRELNEVCRKLVQLQQFTTPDRSGKLQVFVSSFSYKKGYPNDPGLNGGGFVFDCRALPNPGRYPQYHHVTGKDDPVIRFFQQHEALKVFIRQSCCMVENAVENYLSRGFTSLSVAFGCTGGQHRSVYCAEQLTLLLRKKFPAIDVILNHREQS